jgi:Ca2+-binding RTX toxin-like protein
MSHPFGKKQQKTLKSPSWWNKLNSSWRLESPYIQQRRRMPHMELCEPRILLSADTIFDVTNTDYIDNPGIDNILDDFQTGLAAVESVVAGIEAMTEDFVNILDIDLPGLLDRTAADAVDYVAPNLLDNLNVNGVLTAAGFTSVNPGDDDQANEIGDYNDNDQMDFTDLFNKYVTQLFTAGSYTDLDTIVDNLDAISHTFGNFALNVDVAGYDLTNISGNKYELIFDDFAIDLRRTDTFSLDLGRNADALELGYGADVAASALPDVEVEMFFRFQADLGLEVTITEGDFDGEGDTPDTRVTPGDFFVRDAGFTAGASVDALLGTFDLNLGFVDIVSTEGTFVLTADVTATFDDPNDNDKITVTELGNSSIIDADDIVTDGNVAIEIPVTIDAVGFSGFDNEFSELSPSPTIVLSGNPFSDAVQSLDGIDPRTALAISLEDFDVFKPFRNVDADGVIGILQNLKTFLNQFESMASLFGINVPFADATKISDLIDFGGAIDELINNLMGLDGEGAVVPDFTSAQGLAEALNTVLTALELGGIAPTYNFDPLGQTTLSYTVTFQDIFNPSDVNFDFGFDLDPLADFAVSGSLGIDTLLDLSFTFGIDLGQDTEVALSSVLVPYSLISLIRDVGGTATNPVPADGKLTQNARFRMTFGGFGPIDLELAAADGEKLGFDHTESGTGSVTAANTLASNAPGFDVNFELEVDGTAYKIYLAKTATDGNASDSDLISDLNSALADAGVTGVTASLDAGKIVLTADDSNASLEIHSLGTTQDNTDRADLAADLQALIDQAIADAGYAVTDPDTLASVPITVSVEAIDTDGDAVEDRLRITSFDTAFLEIAELGSDPGGFKSLGFDNHQEASSSPLPPNGILNDSATFDLTVGGITHTVTVDPDLTNAVEVDGLIDVAASLENLRADVQAAIDTAFTGDFAAGAIQVSLAGNEVLGFQLKITPPDTAPFVRVDNVNEVAVAELGFVDDAVDSRLQLFGNFLSDAVAANGELGGNASFTIELTDDGGTINSAVITVANANVDNVQDIVDEINSQIAASTLNGMVVAGLAMGLDDNGDTTYRIVFAATPSADADPGAGTVPAKILRITGIDPSLSNPDKALGLDQGMNARLHEDFDAFLSDFTLDASIELDGSATGTARFGFVGIEGNLYGDTDNNAGTDDNVLEASLSIALAQNAPIYLSALLDALGSVDDLVDLLDEDNSGSLVHVGAGGTEEINLSGSAGLTLGNVGITGTGDIVNDLIATLDGVSPSVSIVLSDLFDLDTLAITPNADFGGITDFGDFDFDDVLVILQQIVDFLSGFSELDFLSQPIPLIDITLNDALGFVDDFIQAVEDISNNPVATIQGLLDVVNEGLQQFPIGTATLDYVTNSPGVLTFNLSFERAFADFLPIDLSLQDLVKNTDFAIFLPEDLINLSGQANLAADFGILINLAFGIEVAALADEVNDNPLDPGYFDDILDTIFLKTGAPSSGGTGIKLSAYAEASNVNFTGAIGPLGVFVSNGAAVLNADGVLGNTTPANLTVMLPDLGSSDTDGKITLGDIVDFPSLFEDIAGTEFGELFDFNFGIGAVLPVSFPTASSFLGNIDFSVSLDDPFDLDSLTYHLNSFPDFSAIDLSNLGLLDTLNLFLEGLDLALGSLGDLITGQVFGIDDVSQLPLIGDALDSAGDFIDTIRQEVIAPITNIIQGASDIIEDLFQQIGQTLQDLLDSIGFLDGFVSVSFSNGVGLPTEYIFNGLTDFSSLADTVQGASEFWFNIPIHKTLTYQLPDVDLGLEVFKLEIEDNVDIGLDIDFDMGLGVSLDDGFFLQFSPNEKELGIALTVDLPASMLGRLFLLELQAVDDDPGEADLFGFFNVDVEGTDANGRISFSDIGNIGLDVDFGAGVEIGLGLDLGIASNLGTGFPSIMADFTLGWGFGDLSDPGVISSIDSIDDGVLNGSFDPADYPETPIVTLDNLAIDLGSFISDVIGPFLSKIDEYLGPVGDVIDVITDPIPVLSDLFGPTSLLDVAATFGFANDALITALEVLDQIFDLAEQIGNSGGEAIITLYGSDNGDAPMSFGGAGGLDLLDPIAAQLLTDPGQAITQVLSDLEVTGPLADALLWIADGIDVDALLSGAGGAIGEAGLAMGGGGFSFPFLEDLSQIMGVFFGRPLTFVAYDMPPLEFGWDFSVFISIFDGLGVRLSGGINALLDFAFGYDSTGIQLFASNDFQNPLDLLQGFFIYDDNPFGGLEGVDVPEVVVTGEISAAAELNVVVASAGVGGGITATIEFDFNDPNDDLRIRIDELLGNLYLGIDELGFPLGVIGIFDTHGEITARLYAYIEALFGVWRKEWTFGETDPLVEFNYSVTHPPVLATDMGDGTLRLNIGRNAEFRNYTTPEGGDPADGWEKIYVRSVAGGYEVWGEGHDFKVLEADAQFYEGDFDLILGYGDQGADVIDLSGVTTDVQAKLYGGQGLDVIIGGAGDDYIDGEAGDDELEGGGGNDTIYGGIGADCIHGDAGDDLLFGGVGNDVIIGGLGNDRILGQEDDDILSGEADDDTIVGGSGKDLISGGAGADTLDGGADNDRIWGDWTFQFTGCDLDLMGDEPVLIKPALADQGNDLIAAGGGSDEVQGNGGDDKIWGDSLFSFNEQAVLQLDGSEPVLLLPEYGTFGNDILSGGGGSDRIFGEKGNDLIRGDNIRNDNGDDGNVLTFADGDPLGPNGAGFADADDGDDGDDFLYGGQGSDIVYGNAGDDEIYGEGENDYLFGNNGGDLIIGDAGVDVIFGDDGYVILFQRGVDTMVNGATYQAFTVDLKELVTTASTDAGDDTIDGGLDVDYIFGGAGDGLQIYDGNPVEDIIEAGAADDIVFGDNGRILFAYHQTVLKSLAVTIESILKDEGGDDVVKGSSGRDILIAGKGDDYVFGDVGDEDSSIDSRDIIGGDHLIVTQVIKPSSTPKLAAPWKIESNETDPSQGGNDTIDGKQDDDVIIAGPGADTVTGGLGDDTILGDRGYIEYDTDVVTTPAGLFTLVQIRTSDLLNDNYTGIDTLSGGAGSDTIFGGGKGDTIYGDAETDGTTFIGTPGADILIGDNGQIDYLGGVVRYIQTTDTLNSTGGNDDIFGSDGDDIILGGVGSDNLTGDIGKDILLGDNGFLDYNKGSDGILFLDEIASANFNLGAADNISGGAGDDVAIGGTGGDTIHGDNTLADIAVLAPGVDTLIGDQGRVLFSYVDGINYRTRVETTDTQQSDGGIDIIRGNEDKDIILGGVQGDFLYGNAGDDIILGDDGKLRFDVDADLAKLDLIESEVNALLGGSDLIEGNAGADVAIGGTAGDTIYGDSAAASAGNADGADILLGDNGTIELLILADYPGAGSDAITILGGTVSLIRTTDTVSSTGGIDTISGNAAGDIILGGVLGDTLYGDALTTGAYDGDDIMLGDNGRLEWLYVGDSDFAGIEAGFTFDTSLTTLDLITTELPVAHPGGRDLLFGDDGQDVMFGGEDADTLYGDDGDEESVTASGDNDVMFGDHGRIYPQHSTLPDFPSHNFFSIDTGDGNNGEGDRLWGEEGDDIMLGGQGDDRLWGGSGDDDMIGGHNVAGGIDELSLTDLSVTIVLVEMNDVMDGGSGNDAMAGDNAVIWRKSNNESPRFRLLGGSVIYTADEDFITTNVDGISQNDPDGTVGRDITLLDHADTTAIGLYGADIMAGNEDNDTLFGQLGNDLLQGDGSISDTNSGLPTTQTVVVADNGGGTDQTLYFNVPEATTTDGDDYIEGNGGNDLIYGGLGQDDLIGGSSDLFGLDTLEERPDGSDVIYGGAGIRTLRNDEATLGHGRDSDYIMGDNANIFRLVGEGSYLQFAYDNYAGEKIVPRAMQQLDYTLGGADYAGGSYDNGVANDDNGGADLIFGEDGDDFIFGMVGSDVIYGNAQDDDIIGGYGHDWISGGTGQDGVIGDDGLIYTSRNGTAENLYGIVATSQQLISTPGNMQRATINPTGALKKTVDLVPFSYDPDWNADDDEFPDTEGADPFADDIIYGGWGDDFLHGGSGDDAMSGAEALQSFYDAHLNPGDILGFVVIDADGQNTNNRARAGEFSWYDEYNALVKIDDFLLNFDKDEGPQVAGSSKHTDGNDVIFGDNGNDWLVGGTGRDNLYGGWGNDLLDADDDKDTHGELNDQPDTDASYEDRAYGGAGRDILIGNTGGDRLIDWIGEFNTYLVPFAPYGEGTVSRTLQPQLPEFLYALSAADGADPTRADNTGADPLRNGEPWGELGLVLQQDFAWQAQTGAPADPQAGNIPGGKRDVRQTSDFNSGSMQSFAVDSGVFKVQSGALQVAAESLGKDAIAVYNLNDQLPGYFEFIVSAKFEKPTAGWNANAYLIFDYVSRDDFKFAGIDASTNKLVIGHKAGNLWIVDVQTPFLAKAGTYYTMMLAVNGLNATLVVNNTAVFSHTYQGRVIDDISMGLNYGFLGVGSNNARGSFDNVKLQVLPPAYTFQYTDDFSDNVADHFMTNEMMYGSWQLSGGRYNATANSSGFASSLINFDTGAIGANSHLELSTKLSSTNGLSGIIFDYYSQSDFKFAALDVAADKIYIGHYTSAGGWKYDAVVSKKLDAGVDYTLSLSLHGSTVSLKLNGQVVLGKVFNASVLDGWYGLFGKASAGKSAGSFNEFTVQTDSPSYSQVSVLSTTAGTSALTASQSPSGSTETSDLDNEQLQPLVQVAIAKWIRSGLIDEEQIKQLRQLNFEIGDLDGLALGQIDADSKTITVDINGAGYGWFIDRTPNQDREFVNNVASEDSDAYGKMDLLSVLIHEIGHYLGFDHDDSDVLALMDSDLDAGQRLELAHTDGNEVADDHRPALFFDEDSGVFVSQANKHAKKQHSIFAEDDEWLVV